MDRLGRSSTDDHAREGNNELGSPQGPFIRYRTSGNARYKVNRAISKHCGPDGKSSSSSQAKKRYRRVWELCPLVDWEIWGDNAFLRISPTKLGDEEACSTPRMVENLAGKSQGCGWGRRIGLPPVGSRDEDEVQEQTHTRISRNTMRLWGRTRQRTRHCIMRTDDDPRLNSSYSKSEFTRMRDLRGKI